MTNEPEMTPEFVQIKNDLLRWIDEIHGTQDLKELDGPRLSALIRSLLVDGPVVSETIWHLVTIDGTDADSINATLRALVP